MQLVVAVFMLLAAGSIAYEDSAIGDGWVNGRGVGGWKFIA